MMFYTSQSGGATRHFGPHEKKKNHIGPLSVKLLSQHLLDLLKTLHKLQLWRLATALFWKKAKVQILSVDTKEVCCYSIINILHLRCSVFHIWAFLAFQVDQSSMGNSRRHTAPNWTMEGRTRSDEKTNPSHWMHTARVSLGVVNTSALRQDQNNSMQIHGGGHWFVSMDVYFLGNMD